MTQQLKDFESRPPEIVFEWNDAETGARGWVVINSLKGGAAGGGTRMKAGLTKEEVLSLAKTMEIKFTVTGPPIGGAKSGICFDPSNPQKKLVLKKWYQAIKPLLLNYYGTGGDLNVDEIHDVIPITADLGIQHPQEGIVQGHYGIQNTKKQNQIQNLQKGVRLEITNPELVPATGKGLTVSDMITGFGVAEAAMHQAEISGIGTQNKKALIQGWGNVASAAAWYLSKNGIRICGIIDAGGGIIHSEGLSHEAITRLFLEKKGNKLVSPNLMMPEEVNQKIWQCGADFFIPAAASKLVSKEQLEQMITSGLKLISCGANVPFNDEEIFYGPIARFADEKITVVPDFVANCGMARVFAYLMEPDCIYSDTKIFQDVKKTIHKALNDADGGRGLKTEVTSRCYENALNKLT